MNIFVTGPFRSGSTYMAALLNSQDNVACFEDYPWRHFRENYSSLEEFECSCARIEARFMDLGVAAPQLRGCADYTDMINRYILHLKQIYDVEHIGFKSCMHPRTEILKRIDEGCKVLIMKRNSADILKSWVKRIDPSLPGASVQLKQYYDSIDQYDLSHYRGEAMIVSFQELTQETEKCLGRISEFLGINLSMPQVTYHSFVRGRQEFSINSSHPKKNEHSASQLRSILKERYSEGEILDAAYRIDRGDSLGLYSTLRSILITTAFSIKNKLDSSRFQRVDW